MSLQGSAESYIELKGSMSLPKAIQGKSAYEIALLNGFEGTEAEWLESLAAEANAIAMECSELAQAAAQNAEASEQNAKQHEEKAIEAADRAGQYTEEYVAKWLEEHPEATTTVQEHSLSVDKMIVGTLGYVTPEMFGAIGDGVADDSEAVQNAINTGYTVVFDKNKTYIIRTDITLPAGADIVVNGTIGMHGTFNVHHQSISVGGSGMILAYNDVCFLLKGTSDKHPYTCHGFTVSSDLTVRGFGTSNSTAFLITAESGTNGVVVYPNINCHIQSFDYGIRSSYSGTDKAWFNALTCRGIIENCRYAIILDWGGSGSVLDVTVQPMIVTENQRTDNTPLIRISGNQCTLTGMIWDVGDAPNKYAVEVVGINNMINFPITASYVLIHNPVRNYYARNVGKVFNTSTPYSTSPNPNVPTQMPYDNTNDLAINAGINRVGLSATPHSVEYMLKELLVGKRLNMYVDQSSAPDGVNIEFTFPEAVALREILVSGESLPESVKFEIKDKNGNWKTVKTCYLNKDYFNASGNSNYAWWQFKYDESLGHTFDTKFATGVRITMNITSVHLSLDRIYLGACNIVTPSKYGDDLTATSLKIKGTDGIYYDVTVENGVLTASPES